MTKLTSVRSCHPMSCVAAGALLAVTLAVFSVQATAQSAARSAEPVTLNFNNADIDAVARTFASITGRNVVVDPRVKGTMTLITDKPVSRAAAMGQFVAALRLALPVDEHEVLGVQSFRPHAGRRDQHAVAATHAEVAGRAAVQALRIQLLRDARKLAAQLVFVHRSSLR